MDAKICIQLFVHVSVEIHTKILHTPIIFQLSTDSILVFNLGLSHLRSVHADLFAILSALLTSVIILNQLISNILILALIRYPYTKLMASLNSPEDSRIWCNDFCDNQEVI